MMAVICTIWLAVFPPQLFNIT